MQSASTPILRSALGRAPVTSASPPVLANGTISEDTTSTLLGPGSPLLPGQLPEILGRFLRGGRVDVEAGAPLEPGDLGQLGHDLDVPVVELRGMLQEGGAVDDEVEGGVLQREVQPAQRPPEDGGQRPDLVLLDHLVGALVALWDDPGLEGKPGRVRAVGEEFPALLDDPDLMLHFLDDDVAEEAPVPEPEVVPAAGHLLHHPLRDDGGRDQLGVAVREGGPGGGAAGLEDDDRLEPAVLLPGE